MKQKASQDNYYVVYLVCYFHILQIIAVIQSRTQSPLGFWSAGGRLERLWGTGILLPRDFCGKTMQAIMGQPIKKFKFFRILQPLSWLPPANQKPENSGYEIGSDPM